MPTLESDGDEPLTRALARARARERARPDPRSRSLRVLAVLVVVLVVLVTAAAAGATLWVGHLARTWSAGVGTVEAPFRSAAERPAEAEPGAVDVLLLGTDSRDPEAAVDVAAAGPTGGRSDTMVLVHIGADRRDVEVVSLMRDLWVPVPGHGEAKLNAALAWGGVPLAVATVEDLLGTRIDHVAVVDFEGFREVTDALGGVDVQSPVAFEAQGHTFLAGTNHLRGDAALAFVRARYPFADGDYARVRNQQAFLRGVAQQLVSRETLRDPGRLTATVEAIAPWLSVDAGLDLPTIVALGASLRSVPVDHVVTATVPTRGAAMIGDQSVVLPDEEGIAAWRQRLTASDAPGRDPVHDGGAAATE